MSTANQKLKIRKNARAKLDDLFDRPDTVFVIHYSCESFYDSSTGKSPRVTSIAVQNLDNAQTKSFSIHFEAEKAGVDVESVDDDYDHLEKKMLEGFYEFVAMNQKCRWLHWNMRDGVFGFEAIAHRCQVLGAMPSNIPENLRYDLSRIVVDIYGSEYIGHPRLWNLVQKNKITSRDFLTGEDEAKAFQNQEYSRLHLSTLRKVQVMSTIADYAWKNELKTDASWISMHANSVAAVIEWFLNTTFFKIMGILATISSIGFIIEKLLP